jgi:hypothetical protein
MCIQSKQGDIDEAPFETYVMHSTKLVLSTDHADQSQLRFPNEA